MRLLTYWTSDPLPAAGLPPGATFEPCGSAEGGEARTHLKRGIRGPTRGWGTRYIANGPRGVVAIAWGTSNPSHSSETGIGLQIGEGDLLITLVRSFPPDAESEAGLIAAIVRAEAGRSGRFWYVDPTPVTAVPAPAERAGFATVRGVTLLNPAGATVIPNASDARTGAAARLVRLDEITPAISLR